MPKVAIAGGGSIGLGRAIVVAILETYPTAEWKPIILSRSSNQPLWLKAVDPEGARVELRQTDYDEDRLVSNLKDIHTLISVALAKDGSQAIVQKRLLRAAVEAGCKRYAPSQWAGGRKSWERVSMLRWNSDGLWEACESYAGDIEIGYFNAGMFMNYFGIGALRKTDHLDEHEKLRLLQEGHGYMAGDDAVCEGVDKEGDMPDQTGSFLLSIATGTAEVPIRDDGGYPTLTLTTIRDIGRYVAAALDLPRWEKEMTMVGDTIRFDTLLALAESISGKRISVEKLTRNQLEQEVARLKFPDDIMKQLWIELKIGVTRDEEGEAVFDPVVNNMCPRVKPVDVRKYLEACWSQA